MIYKSCENLLTFIQFTESGYSPLELRYIDLRVISNDECIEMYTSEESRECIHDSTVCTFVESGKGTCNGDSGGPLVIKNQLVGILSWGAKNCASGKPDQFTRISSMIEWIYNKTNIIAV